MKNAKADYDWVKVKAELYVRYTQVSNQQQAHLLHRIKQNPEEDIAVFAGRIKEVAKIAFSDVQGHAVQEQLVHIFVSGLSFYYLKVRIFKLNPKP